MVLQLSKIYWACSISNSEIKMVMNFGNHSNNSENTLHNKMERSKTEVCSESDRLSVDHDRCSPISTTDSITDNSESGPDTNTSLKFGIANILRSNEHSVSAPNSIKFPTFASDELSTISRNSLSHLNTSRLVFNPYFVQNSPILWPVKDISRDRQILTRRVGHPYQNRTPPKKKKPRTSFSRLTIIELEKRFEQQKYLASSERSHLAKTLRISDSQVKTWFQNRRTKWRRQVAEEKEIQRQTANRIFMSIGQTVIQP